MSLITIGEGGLLILPEEVLEQAHLGPGATVSLSISAEGEIVIHSQERDPDQAWFWTEERQAKEREADEDIAAGRLTGPMTGEELIAAFEARHDQSRR